jgi:tRNA pseudouridine55 synthase
MVGPSFGFVVTCSEGPHVRVLVADVGRALGCGGHLTRLRRTAIGPFDVWTPCRRAIQDRRCRWSTLCAPAAGRAGAVGGSRRGERQHPGARWRRGPYAVHGPDGRLIGVWRDVGAKARPEMVLAPR